MFVLHRKMIVHLTRTWAVLFLAAVGLAKAEVTFENGAYRNLLVSFSPNLPSDDGGVLLHSMQDLLANASRVLHTAVGVRIADVTFLLPDSWDVSKWDPLPEVKTSSASLDNSDVLVESIEESAFGKVPLTHQYGGCGVSGSLITVPADFLTTPDHYYPKGHLLAREWLKYRYGVFDENGFPGDSLYPTHYTIPGNDEEIHVTDCTHPQVEYIFKDGDGNNCSLTTNSIDTCNIHPGEISSENVTSSLMFFHKELTKMEHVCGREHLHNNLSPSKQNVLCGEKSIWNVLEQSSDFKTPVSTAVTPEDYVEPEFQYVKQSKPKVAVIFESTEHLDDKKTELLFALRRFVYELPEGSQLSIHTFMAEAYTSVLRPMSELTADSRGNIAPALSFDTPVDGVCPLCAVEKVVDDLSANDNKEVSIILIVGSSSVREDNSALVEKLKNSQHCLKVIALKEVEGYDLLDQLLCHAFEQVPIADDKTKTFDALYQAMVNTLPRMHTDSPTSVVTSGVISKQNEILIKASPTAKDFTIWFERAILENSIRCSDEANENVILTRLEQQSNLGVYSFDSQNKDVKCNFQFASTAEALTQVQMNTKPGEFITESVWIHDSTPTDSKQQMPIITYVKVNFGSYPVSDARVTARVTDPDGNVGPAFELHDNGRGDPDITKDDGVYSKYFFNFNKEGHYLISVEVNDNGGMAKALKKGEDRCCGSEVKTQQKVDVPAFSRSSEFGFSVLSARPEQGYPPSKILDLRVERYEPPTLLELKWTAPGGEADSGKAFGYVFRVFCDSCQPDGSLPGWISINDSNPTPQEAGQDETVQLLISPEEAPANSTIRIGIESFRYNQTSGLSNRVQVRLVEPKPITEEPITPTSPGEDRPPVHVGTIVGATVVGVLVLSVIVVAVCFLVSRTRRSRVDKSGQDLDVRCSERSDSFKGGKVRPPVMRRVESFPVVLYTHDQIKDVKNRTKAKEPPLFRADLPPKPWVSLGELKERGDKDSDGSTSTVRMNDDGGTEEMKQLNGAASLDSELQNIGKVAKF